VLGNSEGVATAIETALCESGGVGMVSESTPTLPSPIKGEDI
jgi:hypothetical protein